MFTSIKMVMGIALVFASSPAASALDRVVYPAGTMVLESPLEQMRPFDVSRTAWPAPVGHRQPRAEDIPVERPKKSASDAELERLERALDGKLMICRGC